MPSHLTLRVFRRLLANEPFLFRCPYKQARRQLSHLPPHHRTSHTYVSFPCRHASICQSPVPRRLPPRRTFLNFAFRPKPQVPDEPEIPPGLAEFIDLNKALHLSHRPAPPSEIRYALRSFVEYKLAKGKGCTDIECDQTLGAFRYLRKDRGLPNTVKRQDGSDVNPPAAGDGGLLGDSTYLADLMEVLKVVPRRSQSEAHQMLAGEIWEVVNVGADRELYQRSRAHILRRYCEILSLTGGAKEIFNLADDITLVDEQVVTEHVETAQSLWEYAVQGCMNEGNEEGLMKALEKVQGEKRKSEILVQFYAMKNDRQKTKDWYAKSKALGTSSDTTLRAVLQFAERNGEREWGKDIFKEVIDNTQLSKMQWDVVLEWATGSMSKKTAEIERMMRIMEGQDDPEGEGKLQPDIATINQLVKAAAANRDATLADQLVELGVRKGMRPNLQTLILQLQYRSAAGDLPGAHMSYRALQSEEILNDEDLPAINEYIRALCAATADNLERIFSVVKDMSDRRIRLDPSTVTLLCKIYLRNSQLEDVLSLLQMHVYTFTSADRQNIMPVFLSFILDPSTDVQTAWDSYNILRSFFSELDVATRNELMNSWFARKRPDMATHTFGHMRSHELPEFRPTTDSYISAFENISRISPSSISEAEESLDLVHNMLKLDLNVDPCTRLWNSLMLAYASIGKPFRALQFWEEITNSEEGPDYRSLEIIFWVLGKKQFGYVRGKEIWERMKRMDIEIQRRVFTQYVGCLAGGYLINEVKTLLGQLHEGKLDGVPKSWRVDGYILGTVFNMLPRSERQREFEEWAQRFYPLIWSELDKLPSEIIVSHSLDVIRIIDLPEKLCA